MTREEAILRLKNVDIRDAEQEDYDALDMAIKALEPKPMQKFDNVKQHIDRLAGDYKCWDERLSHEEALELSRMLEQKPCEDAISREVVLDMIYNVDGMEGIENSNIFAKHYVNKVKALPSVTPQSKVGRWIENIREDGCGELYSYWACSECGRDVGYNLANIEDVLSEYPYCHCGAKMEVNNC